MNIAQERDFYLPPPLTEIDEQFLRMEARESGHPAIVQQVEDDIDLWRTLFAELEEARRSASPNRVKTIETLIHNSEEGYQGKIEQSGAAVLDALVRGDTAWVSDPGAWIDFCLFFATQLVRTKQIQMRIRANLEEQAQRLGYSVDGIWSISRTIDAARLADGIHRSTSLLLLESVTGSEFITGDQPMFNINAPPAAPNIVPGRRHEFIFPVSPKRAVLLVEADPHTRPRPASVRAATLTEVQDYNQVMRRVAFEQVFARRREDL